MFPEIPSSRSRFSAWWRRSSTTRSPALSWMTRSTMSSHSGVAYSGWKPVPGPGAILEEDVGVARPGDDLLEEIAGDVVRRQAALAVQRAGEAVFVLQTED